MPKASKVTTNVFESTPYQTVGDTSRRRLRDAIEHAAHYLPAQGPIEVFVHHNTLHAFESSSFDEGVQAGGRLYGCHAYLPEDRYRQELERGRIRVSDLETVLMADLCDEADRLVASFGTRFALRLAMLQFPLRSGDMAALRWTVAETDALRRFRTEVEPPVRERMIDETRKWATANLPNAKLAIDKWTGEGVKEWLQQFDNRSIASWDDLTWESFVLNFLWRVCTDGIKKVGELPPAADETSSNSLRHRDLLFRVSGHDSDLLVNQPLIRLCSAFLDQGFADWSMPDRSLGFYRSFLQLYNLPLCSPTRWHGEIHRESERLSKGGIDALESIEESLEILGVTESQREGYICQSLLALRGWAGMVWQMETNADWAPHPAPAGSLIEFLAVRLVLDRLALAHVAREFLGFRGPLNELRSELGKRLPAQPDNYADQIAFTIFQLAQVRGWKPEDLQNLTREQWITLVHEIEAFSSLERRRIYHHAFERKYRNETFDALIAHSKRVTEPAGDASPQHFQSPLYQIACCIDDREESFRRHLEELEPRCETFGVAGFFGVAMYYRGVADAHFTPLCPVNIRPQHYVIEQPLYSLVQAERRRAEARRQIGQVTRSTQQGSRTFLGGLVAGLFGSVAAFPLVARILFPRVTAQIRRQIGTLVHSSGTELCLERTAETPGCESGHVGYSVEEMADTVDGGLRAIGLGLPELFSPLVVICGHGSASLNNPHEAAYDCGACGGGRGGPNARAFSQMANDDRVRRLLATRGLTIPDDTYFVGGYHNTCDDEMTWYDLDRIPRQHRELFERVKLQIDEARKRSAHERCRRFESAPRGMSADEALKHVQGRAEDLSQTRPECGHATNALCFVGRRSWSRGLFLDRRAFLTSYDPRQDNDNDSILERLLQAVIPVCAGINLEYYFSYVDRTGYGCGTKLPHNITSLLGVMDGAASDLRPGLPWQMVELHEPVRLLFIIETSTDSLQRIIDSNESIARLVKGDWVQLAVFDPRAGAIHRYYKGEFVRYAPESKRLPIAPKSIDWYQGQRDHLGFASIVANVIENGAASPESNPI